MSKDVTPWLLDYLIAIAQQHGADTSAFPVSTKKKSVQIIKFLSYGSGNLDKDAIIWARVSDKKHHIPIRFSEESVAEHRSVSGHRLTFYRTSLITIKKYRLILSRIPNGVTLSYYPHLVLDCTEFSSRSSYGEPMWDNPRDVEADVNDMREWVAGLRKGGGDGNVLKERNKNQGGQKHVPILLPDLQGSPSCPQQAQQQLKAQPASKPRSSPSRGMGKAIEDFAKKRERRWVARSRYPGRYSAGFEGWGEVKGLSIYGDKESCAVDRNSKAKRNTKRSHPLDLGLSQPNGTSAKKSATKEWPSQQATPPPSGSPELQSRDRSASPLTDWDSSEDEENEQANVAGVSQSNLPSSPSPLSPSPHSIGPVSSSRHRNSCIPVTSPKIAINDLQHSMSPPKSASLRSRVIATQTPSREYGKNVRRKVSPPPQPRYLPLGEKPLVLVPNSDTSGSQGQTQSQSQEEQVKRQMKMEENQDSQAVIAPILAPIPPRGAGNLSQGSIIPETQPQGSESEDEDDIATDGDGCVRETELSMEVHPGTIASNYAGAEDINPQDQIDGHGQQLIYRPKKKDLDHDGSYPENTRKHGADEDDVQTLESLFGLRSTILDVRYKPQDWVKPSFMESTCGHSSSQDHPGASSSEVPKQSCRDDPVLKNTRSHHHDKRGISKKGKKRTRSGLDLDDEQVDGPVGKKTRVKHATCRNAPNSIDREPKLNGYTLGLDDMELSEPWMMTWERLGRILLTTGRARVNNLKSRR